MQDEIFSNSLIMLGSIQWPSEINTNLKYCEISVSSFSESIWYGVNICSHGQLSLYAFLKILKSGIMRVWGLNRGWEIDACVLNAFLESFFVPFLRIQLCSPLIFWKTCCLILLLIISFIWYFKLTSQANLMNTKAFSHINQKNRY